MKSAKLDSSHTSMDAVYAALAKDLTFPAHFGGNLDALWDVLLRDIEGPYEIVWRDAAKAGRAIGPKYKALLALLGELEEARGDFKFRRR